MRLLIACFVFMPGVVAAQSYPSIFSEGRDARAVHSRDLHALPHQLVPPPSRFGGTNSAGWKTGYSIVTTTEERPARLSEGLGLGSTVTESVTKVVPNDIFGNPSQSPVQPLGEVNSAGWSTGYSAVTRTAEKPNPFGAFLGGSRTITETTTQVVPNDYAGRPIQGARW